VLVLSGGGSRGAFGAGVLAGWRARGDRPAFDVVTGISTGALMATFAFLGPSYDRRLLAYVDVDDGDIFEKRGMFAAFYADALNDTAPLRRIIAGQITEETLDAVAREYRRGRRLFIGTTNLDAERFTIWDMGAIAASGRPDRLRRYRDVVLASASMPVVFPPVYLPVDGRPGGTEQMHVDGGMVRTLFFYDYVGRYRAVAAAEGVKMARSEVYVLMNGKIFSPDTCYPVAPKIGAISAMTLSTLIDHNYLSSLYEIEVDAALHRAAFYVASIPAETPLSGTGFDFNRTQMRLLYDLGRSRAEMGTVWKRERFAHRNELEKVGPATTR
jgi:hypothetical protein